MKKITRYQDIPQFTSCGSYQVNMDPKYLIQHVCTEWVEEQGLDLNPDFQRAHVWTQEQQIAYVEYFLRGGTSGRDLYFNHPGWMGSFTGDFVLVDGKQRIEAFRAFMDNEFQVFGSYYRDFTDSFRFVDGTFIVHVNNLKTRKEVLTWYLEMNTGGTVHTDDEIEKVRVLLDSENEQRGE